MTYWTSQIRRQESVFSKEGISDENSSMMNNYLGEGNRTLVGDVSTTAAARMLLHTPIILTGGHRKIFYNIPP